MSKIKAYLEDLATETSDAVYSEIHEMGVVNTRKQIEEAAFNAFADGQIEAVFEFLYGWITDCCEPSVEMPKTYAVLKKMYSWLSPEKIEELEIDEDFFLSGQPSSWTGIAPSGQPPIRTEHVPSGQAPIHSDSHPSGGQHHPLKTHSPKRTKEKRNETHTQSYDSNHSDKAQSIQMHR